MVWNLPCESDKKVFSISNNLQCIHAPEKKQIYLGCSSYPPPRLPPCKLMAIGPGETPGTNFGLMGRAPPAVGQRHPLHRHPLHRHPLHRHPLHGRHVVKVEGGRVVVRG